MKVAEAETLQALLITISYFDCALPKGLRLSIHRIGQMLLHQESTALNEIEMLLQQDRRLQTHFDLAKRQVRSLESRSFRSFSGSDRQSESVEIPQPLARLLEGAAAEVLTADYPKEKAIVLAKRLRPHPELKSFANALEQAASSMNERAIAILRALEKRPIPPEAIAYAVDSPLEPVLDILNDLHQQGYIDHAKARVMQTLLPQFHGHRSHQGIQADTYLTVTTQGRLALHRMIKPKTRRVLE